MSTAVSTGPGESLAADRLLMSGQNSAIFDLALLAPDLMAADSGSAIALDAPTMGQNTLSAETPTPNTLPVGMLTDALDLSSVPAAAPAPSGPIMSSGVSSHSPSDANDADLTQALAALAALEQTGRSSLISRKAQPDLMPSILKAHLGVDTSNASTPSAEADVIDPIAKLLAFPSTAQIEATEIPAAPVDQNSATLRVDTPKVERTDTPEITADSAPNFVPAVPSNPIVASNIGMMSEPAQETEITSTNEENTAGSARREDPKSTTVSFETSMSPTTPKTDSEPVTNTVAIISNEHSDVVAAMSGFVSASTDIQSMFLTLPHNVNTLSALTPTLSPFAPEATTPSELPTILSFDVAHAPAIEEAHRDDRPTFIGELIETPKPIILPNQPMPVTPRTPLADPASAAEQPAFVFTKDIQAAPVKAFFDAEKTQDQNIVRLINEDTLMGLAPVIAETTEPMMVKDHFAFLETGANFKSERLASDASETGLKQEVVALDAPMAPGLQNISNVKSDGSIIINQHGLNDAVVSPVTVKNVTPDDGVKSSNHMATTASQLSRKETDDIVSQDTTMSTSFNTTDSILSAAMMSIIAPAPSASLLPQEPVTNTDEERSYAGSSFTEFTPAALPKIGADEKSVLSTPQLDTENPAREIETLNLQDVIETKSMIESSFMSMNASTQSLIKDFDKSNLGNASAPMADLNPNLNSLYASLTEQRAFAEQDSTSEQQKRGRHPSPEALVSNHKVDEGETRYVRGADSDSGAPGLMMTTTSRAEETFTAKVANKPMISESPTKTEHDDILASTVTDFDKIKIVVTEPVKNDLASVREVALSAGPNGHADHPLTMLANYQTSSVSSEFHSGYSVASASVTPENAATPSYATSDNPLFQIQRDRALESQVIAALKAGRNEVRVSLYPPQLGQVTINLALDGQKVKVALKTSNRDATDLLTAEQPSLSHALQLKGFSLEGFDVTEDGSHKNRKEDGDQPIITPIPASSGSSEFSIDITI